MRPTRFTKFGRLFAGYRARHFIFVIAAMVMVSAIAGTVALPGLTAYSAAPENKVYCPLQKAWVDRVPAPKPAAVSTDVYCASSKTVEKFSAAIAKNAVGDRALTQDRVDELFFSFAAGHGHFIAGLNRLPSTPDQQPYSVGRQTAVSTSNGFVPFLTASPVVYPSEDVPSAHVAGLFGNDLVPHTDADLTSASPRGPPTI